MIEINEEQFIDGVINNILTKKPSSLNENFTMSAPAKDTTIQTGIDRYITVKSKRQRSPNSSEKNKAKKANIEIIPLETANRFANLDKEEPAGTSDTIIEKVVKPPPLYIREKTTTSLIEEIKTACGNEFYVTQIKRGRIEETKIQTKSVNEYRNVVSYFEKNKRNFYTYQMKAMRAFSVVIKGIDASVKCDDIKDELEEKGFKVRTVINIKNKLKVPQPMFRIELEPEKTKGKHPIYDVKYLLYRRIVVEEPYKRNGPVQCFNCQEYGHTSGYCHLETICVSCGSRHKSVDCPNDKTNPQLKKCGNCGENHTANYRGCSVYSFEKLKMLPRQNPQQKLLNRQQREGVPVHQPIFSALVQPGKSYASVVNINTTKPQDDNDLINNESNEVNIAQVIKQMQDNMNIFMNMMQNMMQSMNSMMVLISQKQK